MLLRIWNYIRGYVIIKVSGFSVERFINLAVKKNIYIWDIRYEQSAVFMNISIKGFKMLRDCCRKTKCRIHIVEKRGLPFLSYKYRKRKVLAAGILFFVLAMYMMSSFIWVIEVNGTERINKDEILNFCAENDFKQGTLKLTMDTNKLTQMLRVRFPDISFAAIEVNGTKAVINLVETIVAPEIADKTTPCDVVAKKDGLIISMVTSLGTPKVKEKDVVQKGDVLVSSEVLITNDTGVINTHYVHATAMVYAKFWYDVTLSEKYSYIEKAYTGNTKKNRYLSVLSKTFALPGNAKEFFANFDKKVEQNHLTIGSDFVLPITLVTENYNEFTPIKKQYTQEQLKELLVNKLNEKLESELISKEDETEILDVQLDYDIQSTQIVLKATVTTKELISVQKEY